MRDPDVERLRRAALGDRRAAAALVADRTPALYRLARRLLGDAAEAEDAVQDAFMRLWQVADRWQPERGARLSSWLWTVTSNLCMDRLRKRRWFADPEAAEAVADRSPDAAAILEAGERAARVQAALDALPDRQRAAIVLKHMEGLSQADAAHALAVTEEALESLLARARRSLKVALAEQDI